MNIKFRIVALVFLSLIFLSDIALADLNIIGVADTPGFSENVYISGPYAYVADYNEGLQVVDISNPHNPIIIGSIDTPGFAMDVHILGTYAYIADNNSGLQIIDISNPINPAIVGSVDTSGYANNIYVSGSYAYVADYYEGLQVVDISNPYAPTVIGTVSTPSACTDIFISGSYAYITDYGYANSGGFHIIDITNPENPAIIGSADIPLYGGMSVYISSSYAYVGSDIGFFIIDISEPSNPTIVGSIDSLAASVTDVYVVESNAYLANHSSGIVLVDISNPETPTIIDSMETPDNSWGIYVSDYIYLSDGFGGLIIISYNPCEMPFFSQNDMRWAEDQLGDCTGWYMGWIAGQSSYPAKRAAGCATTSKAMVFNYYHPDYTDPGRLNICLTQNGGYARGCLAPWDDRNNICAPSGVSFGGHIKGKSLFRKIITSELLAGYPVIAQVRTRKIHSHFVVITGVNGSTYDINDPWDSEFTHRTLDNGALGSYKIKALWLYHGDLVESP